VIYRGKRWPMKRRVKTPHLNSMNYATSCRGKKVKNTKPQWIEETLVYETIAWSNRKIAMLLPIQWLTMSQTKLAITIYTVWLTFDWILILRILTNSKFGDYYIYILENYSQIKWENNFYLSTSFFAGEKTYLRLT